MSECEPRCVVCDGDMMFEVPSYTDGDDCPELVCVRCGAAEVLAPVVVHLWPAHGAHRLPPRQRTAA